MLETTLAGVSKFAYYYFNGRLTNRRNWSQVFNPDLYVTDALGSSRLVSGLNPGGGSGTFWDWSDYYPYGGEWVHNYMCCLGNHYKFTGQERDTESNLDNFGARYYTSNLGRFMSPDPDNAGADTANPQSWNAYSYVLNNPLNATDPDGLDCVFLNSSGNGVESIDHNSNQGECNANNGYWANGWVANASNVEIDPHSDNIVISSRLADGRTGISTASQTTTWGAFTFDQAPFVSLPSGGGSSSTPRGVKAAGALAIPVAICQIAEPCGGAVDPILLGIAAILALSQTANHNVHLSSNEQERIRSAAAEVGVDAHALGDAVEQYKRDNGIANDATLGYRQIVRIAQKLKAGDYWSTN